MNFIRENILKIVTFVVILVVVIIVFSFVFKGNGSSHSRSYTSIEQNLKNSAIKYANKNKKLLPKDDSEQTKITLNTLINAKYIKEVYAVDDSNTKCSGYVNILKKDDKYKFIPYIKCGKYYETSSISDYIKNHESVVSNDDGLYKYGEKYVFRGEKPNNYLSIGEKLYRIMEIDEDNSLKLISTKRYDNTTVWDDRYNVEVNKSYGINDFAKSRLKETLDEAYKSEYFTDEERGFMVPHSICIGKRYLNDNSIDGKAECSNVYQNQNISLITINEYARASVDPNCTSSKSESCSNYNYLQTITSSFKTMTAVADNTYQVYRIDYGTAEAGKASSSVTIYPVIYLDKLTLYANGDGTKENPYTIR